MGLLDFLESPTGQGLLGAAFGALGGRGSTLQAIGQGGLLGMNAYTGAKDRIAEQQRQGVLDEANKLKLKDMQREYDDQTFLNDAAKQFTIPGTQFNPTVPGRPAQPGGFNTSGYLDYVTQNRPQLGLKMRSAFAKDTPFSKIDPGSFTPESIARFAQTQNYGDLRPRTKLENVNGVWSDPYTGSTVRVGPQDPNKPFMIGPNGLPQANPDFQRYEITRAGAGAARNNVNVNTGQRGLENEMKLRGDFRGEPVYKAHQEMQSAYSQIQQSLKQATPAGDLAGATKLMKLLDPGSVVRESELGMAMSASGLLDRATNYANMIITGQKLTPTQRQEFKRLADALYGESVRSYNAKRGEYGGFATDYGLNADRVVGPAATMPRMDPARPGPAPSQAAGQPPQGDPADPLGLFGGGN